MSVSMTLEAVRAEQKTVTRRHVDSWKGLKVGDELDLIEKGMGLAKGAKQVIVCRVRIVDVRVETLGEITYDEVRREGLLHEAGYAGHTLGGPVCDWFIDFWCKGHQYRGLTYHDQLGVPCRRIEWEYL